MDENDILEKLKKLFSRLDSDDMFELAYHQKPEVLETMPRMMVLGLAMLHEMNIEGMGKVTSMGAAAMIGVCITKNHPEYAMAVLQEVPEAFREELSALANELVEKHPIVRHADEELSTTA